MTQSAKRDENTPILGHVHWECTILMIIHGAIQYRRAGNVCGINFHKFCFLTNNAKYKPRENFPLYGIYMYIP